MALSHASPMRICEGNAEFVAAMLSSYPRARPALTEAHERIYVEEYRRNRGAYGGLLFRVTAALERWMHRKVAGLRGGRTLELGAGTLNHLQYEPAMEYDIVEPLPALYRDSAGRNRVVRFYKCIFDIPDQALYRRIISVAVLEHVEDLPRIVARSGLLLAPDGAFQAGIPAEGGLLWSLAWRMTTGIAYRMRTGLPYAPVMRHEHLSTAVEIISIVRYCFRSVVLSWFPLPFRHLSFYCYIEARDPEIERCERLLATRASDRKGRSALPNTAEL
jgi:hypothetical protein